MKIVPEKVSVIANVEAAQLTVIMEGFRMTLSKGECEVLRDGLTQGLRQLDLVQPDGRRRTLVGAAGDASEPRRIGSD